MFSTFGLMLSNLEINKTHTYNLYLKTLKVILKEHY